MNPCPPVQRRSQSAAAAAASKSPSEVVTAPPAAVTVSKPSELPSKKRASDDATMSPGLKKRRPDQGLSDDDGVTGYGYIDVHNGTPPYLLKGRKHFEWIINVPDPDKTDFTDVKDAIALATKNKSHQKAVLEEFKTFIAKEYTNEFCAVVCQADTTIQEVYARLLQVADDKKRLHAKVGELSKQLKEIKKRAKAKGDDAAADWNEQYKNDIVNQLKAVEVHYCVFPSEEDYKKLPIFAAKRLPWGQAYLKDKKKKKNLPKVYRKDIRNAFNARRNTAGTDLKEGITGASKIYLIFFKYLLLT
jgi:hypothetical protein